MPVITIIWCFFFITLEIGKRREKKTYDVLNKIQKKSRWYMDSFLTFIARNNNVYHLSLAKFVCLRCVLPSNRQCIRNYRLENVPMVILGKHSNRHLCIASLLHIKRKRRKRKKNTSWSSSNVQQRADVEKEEEGNRQSIIFMHLLNKVWNRLSSLIYVKFFFFYRENGSILSLIGRR